MEKEDSGSANRTEKSGQSHAPATEVQHRRRTGINSALAIPEDPAEIGGISGNHGMEVDLTEPKGKGEIKSREIRKPPTDVARSEDEEDSANHGDLTPPKPLISGDTGTIRNPNPSNEYDPVRIHHPTHLKHYPLLTNTTHQPNPLTQSANKPKPNIDKKALFATKTQSSCDNPWPLTQPTLSPQHGGSSSEPTDPSSTLAPIVQSLFTNSGEEATHFPQDGVTELEERRSGEPGKGGDPRNQVSSERKRCAPLVRYHVAGSCCQQNKITVFCSLFLLLIEVTAGLAANRSESRSGFRRCLMKLACSVAELGLSIMLLGIAAERIDRWVVGLAADKTVRCGLWGGFLKHSCAAAEVDLGLKFLVFGLRLKWILVRLLIEVGLVWCPNGPSLLRSCVSGVLLSEIVGPAADKRGAGFASGAAATAQNDVRLMVRQYLSLGPYTGAFASSLPSPVCRGPAGSAVGLILGLLAYSVNWLPYLMQKAMAL
ncbi:hypothetical protein U1Q18_035906 [Sarracenia purpurea var. burkii]